MGTTECREDSDVLDKVCKVNFPSFLNALLRMPIPGCKNKGVDGVLAEVWCRALWQNEAVFCNTHCVFPVRRKVFTLKMHHHRVVRCVQVKMRA